MEKLQLLLILFIYSTFVLKMALSFPIKPVGHQADTAYGFVWINVSEYMFVYQSVFIPTQDPTTNDTLSLTVHRNLSKFTGGRWGGSEMAHPFPKPGILIGEVVCKSLLKLRWSARVVHCGISVCGILRCPCWTDWLAQLH